MSTARVMQLISRLESLHDGDRAAAELIACGDISAEPLRRFLIDGRPRGIYEPRRWAVEALGALRKKEILMEFLRHTKTITDPVVRFGEDAVENAAAKELSQWHTEDVFQLLMELAGERLLPGFIEALGEFGRSEPIPLFDRALEDDLCRLAAEEALRKLGGAAMHALALSAKTPLPNRANESPSSLLRRRSAMALAGEIGLNEENWRELEALVHDPDPEIILRSVRAGLPCMDMEEKATASGRLIEVLPSAPWFLRDEIAEALMELAPFSAGPLEAAIAARMGQPHEKRVLDSALMTLIRARRQIDNAGQESS